jgi:L-Ala-D/L-Glu epimerase
VEEPLQANDYEGLAQVAEAVGCPIIVDESVVRIAQLARLRGPADRWIVNVRVSKMGGILRSLDLVAEAGRRGIRVVVGAQVGETSLLSRCALTVARAADDGLLSKDVCDPPVMFGVGGVLSVDACPVLASPGLGAFSPDPAFLSGPA